MRQGVLALAAVLVATLIFAGLSPASAASGRIKSASIGMNAPIQEVGVKNGGLAIGKDLRTVYTMKGGDPVCDPSGTTVFAGHASRKSKGVADKWPKFHKGDIIQFPGCKHEVTKVEFWSAKRSIKKLFRVDGSPRTVFIGCKPDDYSKRTMVFTRLVAE